MNNRQEKTPGGPGPTIVDVVRQHAAKHPDRTAYQFLQEGRLSGASITFRELDHRARTIAAFLADRKMQEQRAIILLPPGLDYIAVLFGCLYAGVVAIPGFPPPPGRQRRNETWFETVLRDAGPALAFGIAEPRKVQQWSERVGASSEMQWVAPESIDLSLADAWRMPGLEAGSLALLQYTSGSTSAPRGVMISHGNILHNQRVIQAACNDDCDSTVVGWLPFHHDMGLMGTVFHPAYLGARSVLMSPARFLQNPICWLQAISDSRGHSSSAPNFAYDLCCEKVTDEQKKSLDLSSWRVAVNGAEPVRQETMERFVAAFGKCGFQASAFLPSYGLAESTLMVTAAGVSGLPLTRKLSASALEQNVVRVPVGDEATRVVVGCGSPWFGQEIRIVDPLTCEPAPDEMVGEVWVRGGSVAQGYWNQLAETASTFQGVISSTGEGPFLRTGDLGFLLEGQLFITGRLKDLIIIRGRNFYPQDIEATAQNCQPGIRPGSVAAFAVQVDEQESVVVVAELERHAGPPEVMLPVIRKMVALEHGIQAREVVLVRAGSVPKTTSGKVRRADCRRLFLADRLEKIASDVYAPLVLEPAASEISWRREELLQAIPEVRMEMIESHLRIHLARLLKVSPEELADDGSLVARGLDSLMAVQLKKLTEESLGVKLATVDFLDGASVREVAALALEKLSEAGEDVFRGRGPDGPEYSPLTCGQQGLWVLQKIAPQSVAYTLAHAAQCRDELDLFALERAFRLLVSRHDMLRTVFPAQSGQPVQRVRPPGEIAWDRHFQYRELSIPEAERLPDILEEEVRRPFSLESETPIRLHVFGRPSQGRVLLLDLHHIIADLWSIDVLLKELDVYYSAERERRTAQLPPVRATYPDFARWQSENIEGARGEALLAYWLRQLSGELPVLQLPSDRPRPPLQSYRGSSEFIQFRPSIYAEVERLACDSNATVYMVLVAAFQVLLHRVCGQDDILLGTPTSGRTMPEFADVIGYCVNPVVLRSQCSDEVSFNSYLAEVRNTVLKAFEFQEYPFPLLVDKLQPQRVASMSPIFQAFFVWQKAEGIRGEALASMSLGRGGVQLELPGLALESISLTNSGSQFDLTLMMAGGGNDLWGLLKYSVDLFDAATIKRLGRQFMALLDAIVASPAPRISELPLMTVEEREHLVREWRSWKKTPAFDGRAIHELFEEQEQRYPERDALSAGRKRLSYAQLNAQANQFARHLRTMGVSAEVRVGVCLDRSVESVVAFLGILKSGGAYVPFDARDPKERLAGLMEQSSIQVLITHEQLLDRLPEQLPQLVLLDLDLDLISMEAGDNLNIEVPQESLAYVIHTSGSTGRPKGAMIQHRSLVNLLFALREGLYDSYGESHLKIGLNAPLAFDASIKQLVTLALGHTLCLIPDDVRRNGQALLEHMQQNELDVLDCTPTQLQLLLGVGLVQAGCKTTLLIGGEPIPEDVWVALANCPERFHYNIYGPTECTVDATICRVGATAEPSIGGPLAGIRVYLLDRRLEPLPAGVAGEIFIGGDSVGRGYLEHPELTAEKFLPDPFDSVPGARLYRTGDRARCGAGGNLQFIGRVDRQVKVRGFRIELHEIERALRQCEGVLDSAVIVDERRQIVAYVVSTAAQASNECRQSLSQKLPEYMIPSAVVRVDGIPVNANGKRDYTALPRPELSDMQRGDDYVKAQSPIEEYLVEIWTEVLRTQPIGVRDNFFKLGGDSLQATKMIARVQEKYQTEIPLLAMFFQEPTISALAQVISHSFQPA